MKLNAMHEWWTGVERHWVRQTKTRGLFEIWLLDTKFPKSAGRIVFCRFFLLISSPSSCTYIFIAFSQLSTTIKQFFLSTSSQKTELYNHLQFISIYCLLHFALKTKTCIYITICPILYQLLGQPALQTHLHLQLLPALPFKVQTSCNIATSILLLSRHVE